MRITGFEPGDATHYRIGWDESLEENSYGTLRSVVAFAFGVGDGNLNLMTFPRGAYIDFYYFAEKMAGGRLKAESVAMAVAYRVFCHLNSQEAPDAKKLGIDHFMYHVWKEGWDYQLLELVGM